MSEPQTSGLSFGRAVGVGKVNAMGRAFWLRQLHQWHWISAAISLIGMLAFAVTGITLNHAADIVSEADVTTIETTLPPQILAVLNKVDGGARQSLPEELRNWLAQELTLRIDKPADEWSESEIYISLPQPGGDAWLSVDLVMGEVLYEQTFRGWVSFFNDLHKGRNTGFAWRWFIDVFSVACVVFCLTGLFLLQLHARRRPSTWPLVAAGLVLPAFLIIAFTH